MKKLMYVIISILCFYSQALFAININTASAKDLASQLYGIGAKKAQAIVTYRLENGRFKTVESLARVKGIGLVIVERNREVIELTRM